MMADMDDFDRAALKALLRRKTERNTVSEEAARDLLIREGLYDEDGQLRPQFGGPEPKGDD